MDRRVTMTKPELRELITSIDTKYDAMFDIVHTARNLIVFDHSGDPRRITK